MRDSEIEQRVLNELVRSRLAGCRELCVLSRDGIVTLDGTVPSRTVRLAAQRSARRAKGVIAIINNLQSQPATPRLRLASAPRDLNRLPARARRAAAGAISTY